jgi:hypothetical protein
VESFFSFGCEIFDRVWLRAAALLTAEVRAHGPLPLYLNNPQGGIFSALNQPENG